MTWDRRTKIAAEWLQAEESVADIGCGLMTIEAYLPASTHYIPVDVVSRDYRTIIVDLNKDCLPALASKTAVMLGVLEYLDDLPSFIMQLRQFSKSVVSYNHISLNDLLWKTGLRAKRVDWRNRHGRSEFRRLLLSCGLQIIRERRLRFGEALYEARPLH